MDHLLDRLYKTKLRFAGLVSAVLGIGFLLVSGAAPSSSAWHWLVSWPTNEIGTTLLSAGVIATIFEYYARKEADERTSQHLRQAIRHEAPTIRDAVLDSFAFRPETLRNIASSDTLDRIATNAIALRLGDQRLAAEAYANLRDQVIHSPERWRNVDVLVSLTPWTAGPASGKGSMFTATIRWEYQVRPATPTMRFACVADAAEYRELLRDPTAASVWHFDSTGGLDAGDREAFELLDFSVDGKRKPIRRTERRGSQVYAVNLGRAQPDDEVTVALTYRTLVQRHGHVLYLDLPRPTHGFHTRFDYTAAPISYVTVLDYFASPNSARVDQSPASTPTKTIDVSFGGQIFPRAGVAFVWVLADET